MSVIKKVVKKVLPLHTPAGRFVKRQASKVGLAKDVFYDEEYSQWVKYSESKIFLPVVPSSDGPKLSIVIPFYNTQKKYLIPLLDSIVNQTYQNWELIAADGSRDNASAALIKDVCSQDSRIKYFRFHKDTDISGNTNQGLTRATGDYIVFCDHDDTLSKHALNEVAAAIIDHPEVDVLYSDEDKLSDNGTLRHSPFFKPDWSPHLFLYTNYTNHLSVVRKSLVDTNEGLDPSFNGAQDYEYLLRLHSHSAKPLNVYHIPKVLYHWREAQGSTARGHGQKSYAAIAARRALEEYFKVKNIEVTVDDSYDGDGYFKEIFTANKDATVLVAVMVSDDRRQNQTVIDHVRSLTQTNLKVTFTDSISDNKKYDYTVELNSYNLPVRTSWLDELIGVLQLDITAAVSPRILTANLSKIFDMGKVYGANGEPISIHANHGTEDITINGGAMRVRNVDELSNHVVVYRSAQGMRRLKNQHYVVWAPVDFVHYSVFGQQSYFNPNLLVTEDDRVTVRE